MRRRTAMLCNIVLIGAAFGVASAQAKSRAAPSPSMARFVDWTYHPLHVSDLGCIQRPDGQACRYDLTFRLGRGPLSVRITYLDVVIRGWRTPHGWGFRVMSGIVPG